MSPIQTVQSWIQTEKNKNDYFLLAREGNTWNIKQLNCFQRLLRKIFGCYKSTHGRNFAHFLTEHEISEIGKLLKENNCTKLALRIDHFQKKYEKLFQKNEEPKVEEPTIPLTTNSNSYFWLLTAFKEPLSEEAIKQTCETIDDLIKKGFKVNESITAIQKNLLDNIVSTMTYPHLPILKKLLECGAKGLSKESSLFAALENKKIRENTTVLELLLDKELFKDKNFCIKLVDKIMWANSQSILDFFITNGLTIDQDIFNHIIKNPFREIDTIVIANKLKFRFPEFYLRERAQHLQDSPQKEKLMKSSLSEINFNQLLKDLIVKSLPDKEKEIWKEIIERALELDGDSKLFFNESFYALLFFTENYFPTLKDAAFLSSQFLENLLIEGAKTRTELQSEKPSFKGNLLSLILGYYRYCCIYNNQKNFFENPRKIFELIIKYRKGQINLFEDENESALCIAAELGATDLMRLFCENGAKTTFRNRYWQTALDILILKNIPIEDYSFLITTETVKPGFDGDTPYNYFVKAGKKEIVDKILSSK